MAGSEEPNIDSEIQMKKIQIKDPIEIKNEQN